MVEFKNCSLWISARSPFARRVRIALIEAAIPYEENVVDVFKPTADFLAVSPLGRVPLLRLENGVLMQESHVILQMMGVENRPEVLHGMTLATGLCEKIVEWFIDTLHPSKVRDVEVKGELDAILDRLLPVLTTRVKERGGYLNEDQLTQADIDWGCALSYLSLRYSTTWRMKHPALAQYVDRLEARESFRKTSPPPA